MHEELFPSMMYAKLGEGIFVGLQIRDRFETKLTMRNWQPGVHFKR